MTGINVTPPVPSYYHTFPLPTTHQQTAASNSSPGRDCDNSVIHQSRVKKNNQLNPTILKIFQIMYSIKSNHEIL